jgi:hypothetical protein
MEGQAKAQMLLIETSGIADVELSMPLFTVTIYTKERREKNETA